MTHLSCKVLKASAKQWLYCPALQHCVRRLPWITMALPPVWKFRGCYVASWEMVAAGAATTREELGGSIAGTRVSHGPTAECPFVAVRTQCVPLPFYLFLCMWRHFTLCFACPVERQFLQLPCPVVPLSWESCCQEKMALTLKQRWQCAI